LKKSYFFLYVFFLVFLDQFLKVWVFYNQFNLGLTSSWWDSVPFFEIVYLENSGMAFGFLNGAGVFVKFFLSFFRVFAVGFMFYFVFTRFRSLSFFTLFVAGLVVAGASGNCIDSVFYDYIGLNKMGVGGGFFSGNVIDMLKVSFFPPVFNLADSFITIGCVFGLVFYKNLSGLSV
jgi:signal peptidase II